MSNRPINSCDTIQKHDKRTQKLIRRYTVTSQIDPILIKHYTVTSQTDPITHTTLYSNKSKDPITLTTLYKNMTSGPNNSLDIIQKHDKRTQ